MRLSKWTFFVGVGVNYPIYNSINTHSSALVGVRNKKNAKRKASDTQFKFTPLSHTDAQKYPNSLIHPLWHGSTTTGTNLGPSWMSHSHTTYNKTPLPVQTPYFVACLRAPAASCQPGTNKSSSWQHNSLSGTGPRPWAGWCRDLAHHWSPLATIPSTAPVHSGSAPPLSWEGEKRQDSEAQCVPSACLSECAWA